MTWLPICLFLVLFANNAKLESEFINRLPRDIESTSASAPTSTSTEPSSTASTSTEPSSTASTSTEPSSTASTSTEPSTTASASTEASSTVSTSTEPSSTTSTSTEASSTVSTSTEPSSTASTPNEPSSTAPISTTTPPLEDGDECDANSLNNIVCKNDKLTFCGPNNKIMSVQCVVKGKQGFCNCEKTDCVAQKPVCPEDKTKCYQPNTKLPDNLDCHKFTYCNENKEKITLLCPDKLIYDMTTEKCMDRKSARCHKVVCPRSGKSLQFVPFPQAKNYYVLCYNGIGDVRKCPDRYYAVQKNMCQFDCNLRNASGLFQDSNLAKCKKGYYYVCKRSGSKYITVQEKCPTGQTFDEDLGFCTEENTCKEQKPEKN